MSSPYIVVASGDPTHYGTKISVNNLNISADVSGFVSAMNELEKQSATIRPIRTNQKGQLTCDECDTNPHACDHVLEAMHDNQDAPLPCSRRFTVPMFKTVALPQGLKVEPWEIPVIIPTQDENWIGPVYYLGRSLPGTVGDVLCLVGPYDGRYCIRTAILSDLKEVLKRDGQLPCGDEFHDERFDHEYAGKGKERARYVDSYFRKYLGVCYTCHQRTETGVVPGNLGALGPHDRRPTKKFQGMTPRQNIRAKPPVSP